MTATHTLEAEVREQSGTQASRRLRQTGKIPAVIYGRDFDAQPLTLDARRFSAFLKEGAHAMFSVKFGDRTESAIVKEVQWDTFGTHVLHVDLERVSADQKMHVVVPVELHGVAPGDTAGGVLTHDLHTINLECPASKIMEKIEIDITRLQVGDVIHLRDLALPEGVQVIGDPDQPVVRITEPLAVDLDENAPAPAAPEVIGKDERAEGFDRPTNAGGASGPQGGGT